MRKIGDRLGQGAIEFVIIFGALLVFFIIFFTAIQSNITDKNAEKERIIAQNVALDVQEEISIAADASDGYIRNFTTPLNIFGKSYTLNITDGRLGIKMDGFSATYKIAEVTGEIYVGENTIKKENGEVKLN